VSSARVPFTLEQTVLTTADSGGKITELAEIVDYLSLTLTLTANRIQTTTVCLNTNYPANEV